MGLYYCRNIVTQGSLDADLYQHNSQVSELDSRWPSRTAVRAAPVSQEIPRVRNPRPSPAMVESTSVVVALAHVIGAQGLRTQ